MYIQETNVSPLTVASPNDYSKLPPPGTFMYHARTKQILMVAVANGTGITVAKGGQGRRFIVDPLTFAADQQTSTNSIFTGTTKDKKGFISGGVPFDEDALTDPSDAASYQDYPEFKSQTAAGANDAFKFLLNVGGPCAINVSGNCAAAVPLFPTNTAGQLDDAANANAFISNLVIYTAQGSTAGTNYTGYAWDIPRVVGTGQ